MRLWRNTKSPRKWENKPRGSLKVVFRLPYFYCNTPQEFVGQMTQSERLKEYIPANETFERWTRLMGLRLQNAAQIKNLY